MFFMLSSLSHLKELKVHKFVPRTSSLSATNFFLYFLLFFVFVVVVVFIVIEEKVNYEVVGKFMATFIGCDGRIKIQGPIDRYGIELHVIHDFGSFQPLWL